MKKTLFPLLLVVVLPMLFIGCSNHNQPTFDYDIKILHGKWRITHVEQKDGSMFDVTTAIAEKVFKPTYATFNQDGTYTGIGAFGYGSGTYTAIGKTITTFISGEQYLKYNVVSLTESRAELIMSQTGSTSTMNLIVQKQ